ncbi:MAG: hypothetical protein EPN93_12015 [Spirochaetes bacterium]|nr:MAG: hypothetical protein EPN93_12015 [Spirochaetota bacterium]
MNIQSLSPVSGIKTAAFKIETPKRLSFGTRDYFKALHSWIRAFRRTHTIEPGLYYTGARYDIGTPLVVTCNYHLTVLSVWRALRARNVRVLVIDTDGINVWCSSGKGRFSAEEIMRQVGRYGKGMLTRGERIDLVLPKLALSGVRLSELKKQGVRPVIGPVYASELPAFLDAAPLRDRVADIYRFSVKDRLFTLTPSLVQFAKYFLFAAAGLFAWDLAFSTGIHWQVLPAALGFGLAYILLFPLLPTKKFAVKGIALFALSWGAASVAMFLQGSIQGDPYRYLFWTFFMFATALFFALYYTGNSGVSNYSLVKDEIVTWLPVSALSYVAALVFIILAGVL